MDIEVIKGKEIPIGRLGENGARTIHFHVGNVLREFPDASFTILHQRPGDASAYPVNSSYVELEDTILKWTIQSGDLATEGIGYCELSASEDGNIVKSVIYKTIIEKALDGSGDPPDPWESWVTEVLEAAEDAEEYAGDSEAYAIGKRGGEDVSSEDPAYHNNSLYYKGLAESAKDTAVAAKDAVLGMTATASGLPAGSSPTVSYSNGVMAFGIPAGEQGATGTSYYVHIRYADAQPTQDSDIKTTPSNYIGIYSGTSATAPTTYTSYTWYKYKGETGAAGTSSYMHIRYSEVQPTQDSDMTTTPSDWMGVYTGGSSTAPTTYTSYSWYKIKGAGVTPEISIGTVTTLASDQQAYVELDESSTPEAPVFNFGLPKGETGSMMNTYATSIDMSSSDSTKIYDAIEAKLAANQGSGNAGKFMRVGSGGAVSYELPMARYASASGFPAAGDVNIQYVAEDTGLIYVWSSTLSDYVMIGGSGSDANLAAEYDSTATYTAGDIVLYDDDLYRAVQDISTAESWTAAHWTQTTVAAELLRRKLKQSAVADPSASGTAVEFISGITQDANGVISPSKKTVRTMTGAGASAAGATGLVPAPAAGDNVYYLRGDGTWNYPPGSKLVVVDLDTVTNTSGSYTHSTTLSDVTADMKAIKIELGDPSVFLDTISITTADGSITLSCDSVEGTSTVKVSLMFVAGANTLTSSEFDVLAARIGSLSSLETTAKTSLVAATNELCDQIATKQDKIIELHTSANVSASGGTATISLPSGTNYKNVRIMYAYLYVGFNDPRYYHSTALALTVQSNGILVRNDGGAAGTIYVGIIIVE